MIVSRQRGYIFVHVPKTGGTALALALEARAAPDDILIGDTPNARARARRLKGAATAGRLWKHSRLADLPGLVEEAEMRAMFVFTLVRNPWDRAVSYYHWLRAQSFDHPAVRLAARTAFGDFVRHPHTRASLKAHPYGVYVRLPGGAEHCGAFVRLERFAEDIVPVEAHLGSRVHLPGRVNASARARDWRHHYDESAAAAVAEACAEDIGRCGCRFDP